ncbi:MAG: hypothetical protein QOH61_572 [Chloroflexota bacterium]|jgi:hypothetical protein|nr:hypothetical protein [Chloroflexota bacterium]
MATHVRAMLIEYSPSIPPLSLSFEFNPQTLSRTRTVTLPSSGAAGQRGGYDFKTPLDTPRVAQGASVQPESFNIEVLFDGSDREGPAGALGVQPELDVLRTMLEPKVQGPLGLRTLASLGSAPAFGFQRDETISVVLFVWGSHVLPVFLTSVRVEEMQHLSSLVPLRAKVTITMQVIEGANPFWLAEQVRQLAGAAAFAPLAAAWGGNG